MLGLGSNRGITLTSSFSEGRSYQRGSISGLTLVYKRLLHLNLQVILELTDTCLYIPYIGVRHMGSSKDATAYISILDK